MSKETIKAKYIGLHDNLSASFYDGKSNLTKEEFDIQHGKIWDDMKGELLAGGFISLPGPTKLELLEARISALENK